MKLAEVCSIKHGFAFKGEFFSEIDNKQVVVTPGNFCIGGGFQRAKRDKFYVGEVPESFILNPGDLIVTMTDLSKSADTLGYGAIVPNDHNKYLHNQRIGLVRILDKKIDKGFLHWLLRSSMYHSFIIGRATGSTVKHTSPSSILEFDFDFPEKETQVKIASLLDSLQEKIDINLKINDYLGRCLSLNSSYVIN